MKQRWRLIDTIFVALCFAVLTFSLSTPWWWSKSTHQMIAKAKPVKQPVK